MLEKGLLIYLLINVLVCILYGIDKWKAVHHRWRIPESTLMLSAVFGVFGAFIGMHWFHHKTQTEILYRRSGYICAGITLYYRSIYMEIIVIFQGCCDDI